MNDPETVERHEVARNQGEDGRPRPEWVRGKCPKCGDDLVSNCYYVGGRGWLVVRECWASLRPNPTCDYRMIL